MLLSCHSEARSAEESFKYYRDTSVTMFLQYDESRHSEQGERRAEGEAVPVYCEPHVKNLFFRHSERSEESLKRYRDTSAKASV